jgi:hypothetical protein
LVTARQDNTGSRYNPRPAARAAASIEKAASSHAVIAHMALGTASEPRIHESCSKIREPLVAAGSIKSG